MTVPDELPPAVAADLQRRVQIALEEDIGSGDITAELIDASETCQATLISREDAILCGTAWVDEVFRQLGGSVRIDWQAADGERISAEQTLCTLSGNTRQMLTGERTALNFLQTLSGTATTTGHYVDLVAGTGVILLDTRKTLPGLRTAQKYAVTCGGGANHRIGLYDAFLLKENHIAAHGSIVEAVRQARQRYPDRWIEVEVENFTELEQAIESDCDVIMLDNFSRADLRQAVSTVAGRCKLEASGGVSEDTLRPIAETGVDYISIGGLTKHLRALDLSLRVEVEH